MKREADLRAECVAAITNMTVADAKQDIKNVREIYGLSYNSYLKYHFYELDDEKGAR